MRQHIFRNTGDALSDSTLDSQFKAILQSPLVSAGAISVTKNNKQVANVSPMATAEHFCIEHVQTEWMRSLSRVGTKSPLCEGQ